MWTAGNRAYDEQGADVAYAMGLKLELKPSTLRTWFNHWRRMDKAAAAPKAAPKPKAQGQGSLTIGASH